MASNPVVIGVSVGMEFVEGAMLMSTSFTTAVCIDKGEVISFKRVHTTNDEFIGIQRVLKLVLEDVKPERISRVNICTPQVFNALSRTSGLSQVKVLRLCGPSTQTLPPFVTFPEGDIKKQIMGGIRLLSGGYEFDVVPTANVEISKVNVEEVLQTMEDITKQGPDHVVICGVYSPDKSDQELQVDSLFSRYSPNVDVTLSYQVVKKNGLLQRENASILNASLKLKFKENSKKFAKILLDVGVHAPLFFVENNENLVSGNADEKQRFPFNTLFSLETSTMRAAYHLTGLENALVISIGSTLSVAAILSAGKPRVQISTVEVAGISTYSNSVFTVPCKIGLFSKVHYRIYTFTAKKRAKKRWILDGIGPDAVGKYTDAMVFGGTELTMIDIAVANKLINIGDPNKVESVDKSLVTAALEKMRAMIEVLIDMAKESSDDLPLVLLGLGSALIDEHRQLKGISKIVKPAYFEAAEAIGAAVIVPPKSGITSSLLNSQRRHVMNQSPGSGRSLIFTKHTYSTPAVPHKTIGKARTKIFGQNHPKRKSNSAHDIPPPHIDKKTGEWWLSETDLDCLSIGVGILGSGGGGDPTIAKLLGSQQLKKDKKIRVIAPERLGTNTKLEGLAGGIAYMGDPKVVIEKLPNGLEGVNALKCMTDLYDCAQYSQRSIHWNWKPAGTVTQETFGNACRYIQDFPTVYNPQRGQGVNLVALMPLEIGGMNGFQPLVVSSMTGLPVLDCDGMGRAIPELQMYGPSMYGDTLYPSTLSGYKGERVIAIDVDSPHDLELFFRNQTVEMGSVSVISIGPLDATSVNKHTVKYTISQSWNIGKRVMTARMDHTDPVESILTFLNGKPLVRNGKVTDVTNTQAGGFERGQYTVVGDNNRMLTIDFQNENLVAREGGPTGKVLACCPDLISLVDELGNPFTTTALHYGLRVSVIAIPCSPLLRTRTALKKCGPRALGYDFDYKPVGDYASPTPIPPLPE